MKTRVASTVHRLIHGPALAGACGLLIATSGSPLLAQQSTAAASIDDLQEVPERDSYDLAEAAA